jgi:hypothetical protein
MGGVGSSLRLGPALALGMLSAAVLAGGCASGEQQIARAAEIKARDDSFLPYVEYASGDITTITLAGVGRKQLLGRIDRTTGQTVTLLQFTISYETRGRHNYDTARSSRAEALQLQSLERKSRCPIGGDRDCTYVETLQVTIPESSLRQAGADGYTVKIYARGGLYERAILVPRPLIANLLAKLDAHRAGAPPARRS